MQLTISDLKELLCGEVATTQAPAVNDDHYEIGKPYMIQTVTAFYKGHLRKLTPTEFVLDDCSWVSDTGRFHEFVQNDSNVSEEEPFQEDTLVIVSRQALICAYQLPKLTRKLK